eukprot:gnl/TRDRNA2_/TRDRNA2_198040_c0_seq1.p1 gnl/TRDRNA2_/TRDRNA2_198040_c0~~gnl/TRDRNA2_/TRDRNA2_198040_c0_seq1.p1  ORF type:complete len:210 (+),score=51.80 gnl/TRDRNA2_/TRDRNA2_198040_c0_seq1:48-677(+)
MSLRFVIFLCLLGLGCSADETEHPTYLAIMRKAGKLKSDIAEVLDDCIQELGKQGNSAEAKKLKDFSDNWVSWLGIEKGITGLAKDYWMNYHSTMWDTIVNYHDVQQMHNEFMLLLKDWIGEEDMEVREASLRPNSLRLTYIKDMLGRVKGLFPKEGAMKTVVEDMFDIASDPTTLNTVYIRGSKLSPTLDWFRRVMHDDSYNIHEDEL